MPLTLAVAYYYSQPIGRSNSVSVLMCGGWEYSGLQPKGLVVSHDETWVDWDVSYRMIDNSKWVMAHLLDETRPRRLLSSSWRYISRQAIRKNTFKIFIQSVYVFVYYLCVVMLYITNTLGQPTRKTYFLFYLKCIHICILYIIYYIRYNFSTVK